MRSARVLAVLAATLCTIAELFQNHASELMELVTAPRRKCNAILTSLVCVQLSIKQNEGCTCFINFSVEQCRARCVYCATTTTAMTIDASHQAGT